jgi:hypothetical protein
VIAGHFGFAAAVKGRQPDIPLWALMLATVWLDVVFVPLFVAVSTPATPAEGLVPGYGNAVIHADYTHSLLGAAMLSGLCGWGGWALWGRRPGIVLGLVAFSHWVLDLLVHRADMPVLPANWGDLPRLGLGLWQWPWLTATLEFGLIAAGTWLYWRAAAQLPDKGGARARLVAGLILLGGIATLALDVTGAMGA